MNDFVPVMKVRSPWADGDVSQAIALVEKSGIYANNGPLVHQLEARFAEYFGVHADQVVLTSNGTMGLMGALVVSDVSLWRVPSWTFTATPAAAVWAKKTIHFADVSADDWMIGPDDSGNSVAGNLPVLPFGVGLPKNRSLGDNDVVIDAAASILSVRGGLAGLPQSSAIVFSLHATKPLGVGEGGVVVFGDLDRASSFRLWQNFGLDQTRNSDVLGLNAKMDEVTAALLHLSLDTIDIITHEWLEVRHTGNRISDELSLVCSPESRHSLGPYWVVEFPDTRTRNEVEERLERNRIETRRWWGDGCHHMPPYRDLKRGSLTVTENLAGTTLGLPFHRDVTMSDFDRIAEVISSVRDEFKTW